MAILLAGLAGHLPEILGFFTGPPLLAAVFMRHPPKIMCPAPEQLTQQAGTAENYTVQGNGRRPAFISLFPLPDTGPVPWANSTISTWPGRGPGSLREGLWPSCWQARFLP